jgi:hypothetical protein
MEKASESDLAREFQRKQAIVVEPHPRVVVCLIAVRCRKAGGLAVSRDGPVESIPLFLPDYTIAGLH